MPKEFYIVWTINVSAESPKEAAKEALRIQRDVNSIATVFDVFNEGKMTHIDLINEE